MFNTILSSGTYTALVVGGAFFTLWTIMVVVHAVRKLDK